VEQLCGSLDRPKIVMQGATFNTCTLIGPDELNHSRGKSKREGLRDELAETMDQRDWAEVLEHKSSPDRSTTGSPRAAKSKPCEQHS
jgi:hypothetical protein